MKTYLLSVKMLALIRSLVPHRCVSASSVDPKIDASRAVIRIAICRRLCKGNRISVGRTLVWAQPTYGDTSFPSLMDALANGDSCCQRSKLVPIICKWLQVWFSPVVIKGDWTPVIGVSLILMRFRSLSLSLINWTSLV